MPTYKFDGPDGKTYKFDYPTALQGNDLVTAANVAFEQIQTQTAETEAKQGLLPNLKAGAAQAVGTGLYGISDLLGIDAGKEAGKSIAEGTSDYANVPTFEQVKGAYGQSLPEGLAETADFAKGNTGQVLGGLPLYLGAAYTGGRAGALAGAPFGPVGSAVGGGIGAVGLPALTYFYGGNRMRQEEEVAKAKEAGLPVPEFNTAETLGYSVAQSGAERLGLGVLGRYFPVVSRLLGKSSSEVNKNIGEIAKTGLTKRAVKGAAAGIAAEVPVELTQTVLERQAAGLPLTDEDAYNEYEEVLAATVAGVAPLGAGAGVTRRVRPEAAPEVAPDETPDDTPDETPPAPFVGPVPPEGEQLAMDLDTPQPATAKAPEPIPTTDAQPAADIGVQGEIDFVNPHPLSKKGMEDTAANQEAIAAFEAQDPDVKLGKMEDELSNFDALYPTDKYGASARNALRQDLKARSTAYKKEITQRDKVNDAEFKKGVEYLRTQGTPGGVVDIQMARAMGVSPKAKKVLARILGQDLNTVQGRYTVAEALQDYDNSGGGRVPDSPYGVSIVEGKPTDEQFEQAQQAEAFQLDDTQEVMGPEPVRGTSIESLYKDEYKRAIDRNDIESATLIDSAAREAVGSQRWSRIKSDQKRKERSQQNQLIKERGRQPDMFPPEEAIIPEPVKRVPKVGVVPDIADLEGTTNAQSQPAGSGTTKRAKGKPIPKRETAVESVEVDSQPETDTSPTEGATAPELDRVGESGVDVSGTEEGASPQQRALTSAGATETTALPDGSLSSVIERDGTRYRVIWSPKGELVATPMEDTKFSADFDLVKPGTFTREEQAPEIESTRGPKQSVTVAAGDQTGKRRAQRFINQLQDSVRASNLSDAQKAEFDTLFNEASNYADTFFVDNPNTMRVPGQLSETLSDVQAEVNRALSEQRIADSAGKDEVTPEDIREFLLEEEAKQIQRDVDALEAKEALAATKRRNKVKRAAGEEEEVLPEVAKSRKQRDKDVAKRLAEQRAQEKADEEAATAEMEAEAEREPTAAELAAEQEVEPEAPVAKQESAAPKSVLLLQDFTASNLENERSLQEALDVAVNEGIYSPLQAELSRAKLDSVPTVFRKAELYKAAKLLSNAINRTDYMRGNPKAARALSEAIANTYSQDFRRKVKPNGQIVMSTADQLKKASQKFINKLRKDTQVEIHQSPSDVDIGRVIPDDVQGMYHEGKVYVFADNVAPSEINTVLAHEIVGHKGMEEMLGKAAFNEMVSAVDAMRSNPKVKEILKNVKAAYTNVAGEYALDKGQETREIIAHLAEGKPNYVTDGAIKQLYNKIVQALKSALAKIGLTDMAESDMDRLIMDAAQHVRGSDHLTGAGYMTPHFAAVGMMQRAWKLGYRGTDVDEAGQWVNDIHSGKTIVPTRTNVDVDNIPADYQSTIDYNEPAFSRMGPAVSEGDGSEFNQFITENQAADMGDNFWKRGIQALKDGRLMDTFRTMMVDSASVFDDRVSALYKNAITDADGMANSQISFLQALRAEGLAAQVMRTGQLELDKFGVWDAGDPATAADASMKNIMQLASKLGDRIGHQQAQKAINLALIAKRHQELESHNADVRKGMATLIKAGKKDEAEKMGDAKLVNPYYDVENPQHMAEFNAGIKAFKDYPEITELQRQWREFNNMMIDRKVETGILTEEHGEDMKGRPFYVPFSRVVTDDDGEFQVGGYRESQSGVSGVQQGKRMKGALKDVAPVNDVLDNMIRLTTFNTGAIVRNHAAKKMVADLEKVPPTTEDRPTVRQVNSRAEAEVPKAVVSYWDDGARKFFELDDPLTAAAFKGTEQVSSGLFGAMAQFANVLRKGVTLSPEFILGQLQNDIFRSYIYGGTKHPLKAASKVAGNFMRVRQDLAEGTGGDTGLNRYGIAGMFDYSPSHSREQIERAYKDNAQTGFQKIMLWAERNAEASDLAPRKAIFDQTMAETNGNVPLALQRASEIINFNRRGAGTSAALLRQIIPFQNAYMQGMNVMFKAMSGRGLTQLEKATAMKEFLKVGLKLSALSAVYAMTMADDDDYTSQADYLRSRFYLLPTGDGSPPIKLAAPADIGLMFKLIPEMLVRQYMFDNIDSEAARREFGNAFLNAVAGPDLIPQIAKPLLETSFNYSTLTGSPIISQAEEGLDTEKQFRDSTSELGRLFGQVGVSPIKFDHMFKGMLGSLGGTTLALSDEVLNTALGLNRPTTPFERNFLAKTLFAPRFGAGTRADFYQLREHVLGGAQTLERYKKDFNTEEEITAFVEENLNRLGSKPGVNVIGKHMADINEAIRTIERLPASKMKPAEKRAEIDRLRKMQNELQTQIKELRKLVYD